MRRRRPGVIVRGVAGHLGLVAHEAAADREIGVGDKARALAVESLEGEGVGMLRRAFVNEPEDVARLVEGDGWRRAAEAERLLAADAGQRRLALVRVQRRRLEAGQA